MLLETVMPSFNDNEFCSPLMYIFVYLYIYLTVVFEALAKRYGMMRWVVKNILEKIVP